MKKEQAFIKMYELINFYHENRDKPVEQGFDFFKELKLYCDVLELDDQVIIQEFKLNSM